MRQLKLYIATLILIVPFAAPAKADMIFTIEAEAGGLTGLGTMVFADGTTGFVRGTDARWLSFDFSINGETFGLGDMFNASGEGVILSALGEFVSWSNGNWVEFAPVYPGLVPTIGFGTGTGNTAFYYSRNSFQDTRGTHTVAVAEPGTLSLLGIGLLGLGLGFVRRRKTA